MSLVTGATLISRVRYRCDIENDTHVADTEIMFYLNDAYCFLRDLLIENDQFFGVRKTFTTTANQLNYVLNQTSGILDSNNFYKMLGLYCIESGSSGTAELRPLRMISDSDLQSYRAVDGAYSMEIHYVPTTALAVSTDTYDGINGYEELLVILAAIDVKQKRDEDARFLIKKKDEYIDRIRKSAKLNSYEPKQIKRVFNRKDDPLRMFRQTVHAYRIVGSGVDGVADAAGPTLQLFKYVGYLYA